MAKKLRVRRRPGLRLLLLPWRRLVPLFGGRSGSLAGGRGATKNPSQTEVRGPGLEALPRTAAADLVRLPPGRRPGGGRRGGKLWPETLPPLRRPCSSLRTRLTGKHRFPPPRPPFPFSPPLGSFPLPYSFPGCPSDDRGLARILWSPPLPGFYWFERCKQRRHFPTSSMETESYALMLPGICSPLFRTNWHTPGRKNYQNRNAACLRSTRAGRGRGRGHKAEGRWHTTPAQCDRDGVFSCTE